MAIEWTSGTESIHNGSPNIIPKDVNSNFLTFFPLILRSVTLYHTILSSEKRGNIPDRTYCPNQENFENKVDAIIN